MPSRTCYIYGELTCDVLAFKFDFKSLMQYFQKNTKNFQGRGTAPFPGPSPSGEVDTSFPHPTLSTLTAPRPPPC